MTDVYVECAHEFASDGVCNICYESELHVELDAIKFRLDEIEAKLQPTSWMTVPAFEYTDERVEEILKNADVWIDAFWHGALSPHGDHGPIIALVELARAYYRRDSEE